MSRLPLNETGLRPAVEQLMEKVRQSLSLSNRRSERVQAVRTAVQVEKIDPLAWLAVQPERVKIYWRGRQNGNERFESAAVGVADEVRVESAPLNYRSILSRISSQFDSAGYQTRYWGGIQFHTDQDHADNLARRCFPAARFILPRFELAQSADRTELACNFILPSSDPSQLLSEIIEAANSIMTPGDGLRAVVPTVIGRDDTPDQEAWCDRVAKCLETINNSSLQKIVLARRSTFRFTRLLDPWALLDGFRENDHGRFLFGFQAEPGATFVCASPELLYARAGRKIRSEALAGTRPRSVDRTRDLLLGEELLSSDKERREHAFVEEQIAVALNELCSEKIVKSDRSLVKLQHVQHLVSYFTGNLRDDISDAELLRVLHPTPAVGGLPREKAMELICSLETFDRSWYAGPVGWIGPDQAEFVVGIRSGFLQGSKLTLFSGAGIVDGSIPTKEWDEIENKIAGFLSLLTH